MSRIQICMALAIIGGFFLLTGVQSIVSAQEANDTSMMENATNATLWNGNATNATAMMDEGMTGNISGAGCPPRC